MKISILSSDENHPICPYLESWCRRRNKDHSVELLRKSNFLKGGDILFLISCQEILTPETTSKYAASLVAHASDLPRGRGWSPHIWQVLEGCNSITMTLLEADREVDSGRIWAQQSFSLEGHELYDEINEKLFSVELGLMDFVVENFELIKPCPQAAIEPTHYRKRSPEDSKIDPHASIADQFDHLRVADPYRYPAFFDYRGYRYRIALSKVKKL